MLILINIPSICALSLILQKSIKEDESDNSSPSPKPEQESAMGSRWAKAFWGQEEMLLKKLAMNQAPKPDPKISEIIRISQQILHNIELFKIYLHLAIGLAKFKSIRQECPEMFETIVRNLEETAMLEQQVFDLCNSIPGFVERFMAWRAQR